MKFTISTAFFGIITVFVRFHASEQEVCPSSMNGVLCKSSSKYRSIDGSCNNLNNPGWGTPNTAFSRILLPAYEDGTSEPTGGLDSDLPNARQISLSYLPPDPAPNPDFTNMVSIFGQFINDDMFLIDSDQLSPCCTAPTSNANCWPIQISSSDPYFQRAGGCLNYMRSTSCQSNGVRQQINAKTAYIDASTIYGNNVNEMRSLRSYEGGKLKPCTSSDGTLLSLDICLSSNCDGQESPSMMNVLFVNEHNRIASAFVAIKPRWNDEKIFQETRRIVIAELQQITYDEYLPLVLGSESASVIGSTSTGFSTYDSSVEPSTTIEYATAAYIFATSELSRTPVQENFGATIGLTVEPLLNVDLQLPTGATYGADFVSQNIQMGRDHGLQPYSAYFNLPSQQQSSLTWNDLASIIYPNSLATMEAIYGDPNIIDLFVGGLSELPTSGLSGPTFTALKALQFSRAKFGDRFFFTHNNQAIGFTTDQLNSIRQRRLSDIICDNAQQPSPQGNIFLAPSQSNPSFSCANGPQWSLDLSLFNQR